MDLHNLYRRSPAKAQQDEQELRRLSKAATAFTNALSEETKSEENLDTPTAMLCMTLRENGDDLHHHLGEAISKRGNDQENEMVSYHIAKAAAAWNRFAYIIGTQSRLDHPTKPWEKTCTRCGLRKENPESDRCMNCEHRIMQERIIKSSR